MSEKDKRRNTKDLTNCRFGYLEALEPTEHRDNRGCVVWKCICYACGETAYQSTAQFYHNKSCGCIDFNIQKKLNYIDGTCVELLQLKTRKDNTSGFRGISMIPSGKWKVSIGFKGVKHYLGIFDCFEEAKQARLDAEKVMYLPFLDKFESVYRMSLK